MNSIFTSISIQTCQNYFFFTMTSMVSCIYHYTSTSFYTASLAMELIKFSKM